MWQKFLACEQGSTAIEYGLIATLIAAAAIGGFTALGGSVNNLWGSEQQPIRNVIDT